MTQITYLPGTPDASLPRYLPNFGATVTHLYSPDSMTSDMWNDVIGTAHLPKSGTGTATVKSENGVNYLHSDGASRFMSTTLATTTEATTAIVVYRPEPSDIADGTAYIFNGGSTGITNNPGTLAVSSIPSSPSITLPSLSKWYCMALVANGTGPVRIVVDNMEQISTSGTTPTTNTIRLFGGATSYREARLAMAMTSSQALSTAVLKSTVFPRIRDWLSGLDFAT